MIDRREKELAAFCVKAALAAGASAARASLSKSISYSIVIRDGKTDKISRNADRSIYLHLFVRGRFGSFSTNRLEEKDLESFVKDSIAITEMLAEDPHRALPDLSRTAKGAVRGDETGLLDYGYEDISAEERMGIATAESGFLSEGDGWNILSEEIEYSDNLDDNYIIDSNGFEGRHTETLFGISSEVTIEADGRIYSSYWWDNASFLKDLPRGTASKKALERAVAQIGPKDMESGLKTMVVSPLCAARLVGPVLTALQANAVQQKNSFLEDRIGKAAFCDRLTILDRPHAFGKCGSKLFDTEGVATKDRAIIENGVVKEMFVNTWIAGKMGIQPTIEAPSRIELKPFGTIPEDGILVTGFNGGNCNQTTGDFSYGVEGFVLKDGKPAFPVREMLITGNMLQLWSSLIAVGNDPKPGTTWAIPTLAFTEVSFSK